MFKDPYHKDPVRKGETLIGTLPVELQKKYAALRKLAAAKDKLDKEFERRCDSHDPNARALWFKENPKFGRKHDEADHAIDVARTDFWWSVKRHFNRYALNLSLREKWQVVEMPAAPPGMGVLLGMLAAGASR